MFDILINYLSIYLIIIIIIIIIINCYYNLNDSNDNTLDEKTDLPKFAS